MTRRSPSELSGTALSWPSSPHDNKFVDTVCGMLTAVGFTVRPGNPTFWSTPFDKPDLYVIHWPDAIFWGEASQLRLRFWIARILTNLTLLKARGTRILWFVHNLQPHELSPEAQRHWSAYTAGLSRLVDAWITLSPSTSEPVIQRYPALARKPHTFIWHPPYADAYGGTRAQARAELALPEEAVVIGHAGLLRPYKNLAALAGRFERIAPEGAILLLTGLAKGGAESELNAIGGRVDGLHYREGRLSAAEFDRALTAMDVFVAPYTGFLHSGSLVHALSRGCVVVAPRVPFTEDLKRALGSEWMVLYDEDDPSSNVLARAADAAHRNGGVHPDLSFMEPEANAVELRELLFRIGLATVADKTETAVG